MIRSTITKVIDTIFPPRCLCCYEIIADIGTICADCWSKIDFISPNCCKICSMSLDYQYPDNICNNCNIKPPYFDHSICVFTYNEFSKEIIHRLKFKDNTQIAKYLSQWLKRTSIDILAQTDIIAPVPIHFYRLITRKFNQSALLAKFLLDEKLIYYPNLLVKHKHTKAQLGLSYHLRQKNIIGSFKINTKYRSLIAGKNITLVDDVITTGATANECAKILKSLGANKVFIIALARTDNA